MNWVAEPALRAGRVLFAGCLALALSACGGGGGGGDDPAGASVGSNSGTQGSQVPPSPVTVPVVTQPVTPPVPPTPPAPSLTWGKVLDTGFKSSLLGIAFLDAQVGHAFGSTPNGTLTAGVLQRTSDGGDSWSSIAPAASRGINTVAFVSRDIGWAGGLSTGGFFDAPHSYLFKTTDGGGTWEERRLPTCSGAFGGHTVYKLQFIDEQKGWVSSTCGLMRTDDAGQNWVLVSSLVRPTEFSFATEQIAWSSAGSTSISRSEDGGATWQTFEFRTLFPQDEYGSSLTSVKKTAYFDALHAWAAVARTISSKDAFFRTRDGGASWQALSLPAYVRVAGLQFVSADRGWLLDSSGELHRTDDGGESWTQVTVSGGPLWSMSRLVVIGNEESVFSISFGDPSSMPEPFAVWSSVWRARLP